MIIDATNLIAGRLATFVAKKALQGETIEIINSEKALYTGNKQGVLAKFRNRRERGAPLIGPYYPRQPDRFLKRTIRGMIPYKTSRGDKAFKSIKCHVGVPKRFEGKETQNVPNADISKVKYSASISVGKICEYLGGKI